MLYKYLIEIFYNLITIVNWLANITFFTILASRIYVYWYDLDVKMKSITKLLLIISIVLIILIPDSESLKILLWK